MYHLEKSKFKNIWSLIKPYWFSEDKWKGRLLLVTIISLSLIQVFLSVVLNKWNAAFYNALQDKNLSQFLHQIEIFVGIAIVFIAVAVYQQYFSQMLHIRWRSWMTEKYQQAWLSNRAYYRLQVIYKSADNPDQRIADDIDGFTGITLSLAIGLLSAVVTFGSFITILWGLSGTLTFSFLGHDIAIKGYMVWTAMLYAAIGTWLTQKIGRKLIRLNYDQQHFEANYRFSMIRLRENAEAIAFYKGEQVENATLREHFEYIRQNWWQIMKKQKQLTWFTSGYGQIAVIFPILVAAPRYFFNAIQLGGLMQTASAFGRVQESLSWLIDMYPTYANWKATTDRLIGFMTAIDRSTADQRQTKIIIHIEETNSLVISNLTLNLPAGETLVQDFNLILNAGERVMLTGPSGKGKTTILRAIAGLWPYGSGDINIPANAKWLFIPQKPYLVIKSLKDIICYPETSDHYQDKDIVDVLHRVGLEKMIIDLDKVDNWSQSLSLGEQQKLIFARILLYKPDILLLDEVTASLDEGAENYLYESIISNLPNVMIISVSHKNNLMKWHQKTISL